MLSAYSLGKRPKSLWVGICRKHIIWPFRFPSPVCHLCSLQAANACLPFLSMDSNPTINNMRMVRHNKHFGELTNSSSPLQDVRLPTNACFISLRSPPHADDTCTSLAMPLHMHPKTMLMPTSTQTQLKDRCLVKKSNYVRPYIPCLTCSLETLPHDNVLVTKTHLCTRGSYSSTSKKEAMRKRLA